MALEAGKAGEEKRRPQTRSARPPAESGNKKACEQTAASASADAPSHHVRIASGPHKDRRGIFASQKKGWTTVLLGGKGGFMEEVRVPTKDVVWPSAAREPPNQAGKATVPPRRSQRGRGEASGETNA